MTITFVRTNASATVSAINAIGTSVSKAKEALAKAKATYRNRLITMAQPALKLKEGAKVTPTIHQAFYDAFVSERESIYQAIDAIYHPQDEKTENQSLKKHFQRVLQDVKKEVPVISKLMLNPSEKAAKDRTAKQAQRAPKVQPQKPADKKPAATTPYDVRLDRKAVLTEIDNTMANLYDTVSGHMPAEVLAAFTTAVALLQKTVADSWKK